MKGFLAILFLTVLYPATYAQNNCHKLGVWLWHLEGTAFSTHEALSDALHELGVQRIYVKVADGRIDSVRWPELIDEDLIQAYKKNDLEVWAWSYNYPGNEAKQGEALHRAAKNGYDGFIVDIEMEFDGDSENLNALLEAFERNKRNAIANGYANDDFVLGVTTWGNPADHNYRIDIIDNYVDAYFPQTYIENWGASYLEDPFLWIEIGNREYKELGATKPIHHIVSTEKNIINADQLNNFLSYAGPQSSIWRIPGSGTPLEIWDDWEEVNWKSMFCETTSTKNNSFENLKLYPNPTRRVLKFSNLEPSLTLNYEIRNLSHQVVLSGVISASEINVDNLISGFYTLTIIDNTQKTHFKFVKI